MLVFMTVNLPSVPRFVNKRTALQRTPVLVTEEGKEVIMSRTTREELCPRNQWGEDNLFPIREQPMEGLCTSELLIHQCFKLSMCMCVVRVCGVWDIWVWCLCVCRVVRGCIQRAYIAYGAISVRFHLIMSALSFTFNGAVKKTNVN